MNSAAEWVASIPDMVSAREALVFIDQALRDADEATEAVRGRFTGTLPPRPWPQSEQMQTMIKALEGGQLLLGQAVNAGHGDTKQPKNGPTGSRLINGGRALYAEIAKMQQRAAELPTAGNIPELVAEAAKQAAATRWGGLFVIAGLLYLEHHFGGDA